MADEKSPEQLQQEMFDQAQVPPAAEPEPAPPEPIAPAEPVPPPPPVTDSPEVPIPSWRLREEAEARRLAEDRSRTLEARLNEIQAHLRQQGEKQPDFFEDPNKATEALIVRTLQPFAESQSRTQMYDSEMLARYVHGTEKVSEAEKAFLAARDNASLDPADYERVVGSPNRYDAVVQWHQKQTVLSSVGPDPEAWYKKRREAEMDDPKFQAEMMARMKTSAASRPSETRLPPSLSKSTAAASSTPGPEGDMSDQSLFRYAMSSSKGRTQ